MSVCKTLTAITFSVFLVTATGASAFAEGFIDLYGGSARTSDSYVKVDIFNFPAPDKSATRNISFDDSVSVGVRAGGWSSSLSWLGGCVDLSYFKADGNGMNATVIPLSAMLMFRYPAFKSSEYPNGRLQPYVAFGPGLFFYHATVDFQPELQREVTENSFSAGIDARAGLTWMFSEHWGFFGEYRYTYFKIDEDFLDNFSATMETSHWLLGLSYRF
ncbi:MAG TPA: outer membrane beta-barrel protein [Syntrophales bacterium]|nr:outer membrane beta-barrel protein [Syntrophales bacterium]